MKYKPISNQTHKACAYTLAIVNDLFFIDGWGVGTIPAFIHSRNLISSSCPGVQNGPYFWWMALLLMPTILPSLCTIDFSFYLFLWVPYSFRLYGDFLFLDLSNMKSFLLMLWSWSRKEFRFNLLFHPGCKKKKVFGKMAESGDHGEDNIVILVTPNSLLFGTFISLHFFTLKNVLCLYWQSFTWRF